MGWLMHILLPGTILTDAHAAKKKIKMADKLAEKEQAEKDKYAETMAEINAGDDPDLTASKASGILKSSEGIVGSIASIFGGKGNQKNSSTMYMMIGGVVLLIVAIFAFSSKSKK